MRLINFPNNPQHGDIFERDEIQWFYDGEHRQWFQLEEYGGLPDLKLEQLMTLNNPQDGDLVQYDGTNWINGDNYHTDLKRTKFSFEVRYSANHSIPAATITPIQYDNVIRMPTGYTNWDTVNHKFTIPVTGIWFFNFVWYAAGIGNRRDCRTYLRVNNTTNIWVGFTANDNNAGQRDDPIVGREYQGHFNAGDVIEGCAYCNISVTLNSTDSNANAFCGHLIEAFDVLPDPPDPQLELSPRGSFTFNVADNGLSSYGYYNEDGCFAYGDGLLTEFSVYSDGAGYITFRDTYNNYGRKIYELSSVSVVIPEYSATPITFNWDGYSFSTLTGTLGALHTWLSTNVGNPMTFTISEVEEFKVFDLDPYYGYSAYGTYADEYCLGIDIGAPERISYIWAFSSGALYFNFVDSNDISGVTLNGNTGDICIRIAEYNSGTPITLSWSGSSYYNASEGTGLASWIAAQNGRVATLTVQESSC